MRENERVVGRKEVIQCMNRSEGQEEGKGVKVRKNSYEKRDDGRERVEWCRMKRK